MESRSKRTKKYHIKNLKSTIKKIHFIGICGVAMSAIAIALQKKGYRITGSDKGFYPPVSDTLEHAGIAFYPGWHVDRMTKDGDPDLVVVGNVAGSENPEWRYTRKKGIPFQSYPEVIAEFFVKKNSIVCAGTYGKTTSSALLSWILKESGFSPTYMFGGVPLNDMPAAEVTDSEYSILEGDEYKSARWDMRPKFAHYVPTHVLLTSVVWDHADLYPTEASYLRAFQTLVESVPKNGLLVLSERVQRNFRFLISDFRLMTYGEGGQNEYQYFGVQTTKNGLQLAIQHKSEIFNLKSEIISAFMADNITGCFAMAHELGIEPHKIIAAIASFKNLKRRLEKRFDGDVAIFDDIAHSPQKAAGVLESLRTLYHGKLIAVFEPNTGNRKTVAEAGYRSAFRVADRVIIPRLTAVKVVVDDPDPPFDGARLAEVIRQTHENVDYMPDDAELVDFLATKTKKDDCVVFLGSHGFRGMIDEFVKKCSSGL